MAFVASGWYFGEIGERGGGRGGEGMGRSTPNRGGELEGRSGLDSARAALEPPQGGFRQRPDLNWQQELADWGR